MHTPGITAFPGGFVGEQWKELAAELKKNLEYHFQTQLETSCKKCCKYKRKDPANNIKWNPARGMKDKRKMRKWILRASSTFFRRGLRHCCLFLSLWSSFDPITGKSVSSYKTAKVLDLTESLGRTKGMKLYIHGKYCLRSDKVPRIKVV